ncbi:hypothetical protein [Hyphococcus sp.]|uniref:hypothetical protein n=1 Tax=Hyphococcus sp. TaxID=2038636 RepID=UPI003D147FC6
MSLEIDDLPPLRQPTKSQSDEIYEKYRHMLPPEMPEKAGRDHIEALWMIMQSFVDLAFGQDAVSMALAERKREDERKPAKKKRAKTRKGRPAEKAARLKG